MPSLLVASDSWQGTPRSAIIGRRGRNAGSRPRGPMNEHPDPGETAPEAEGQPVAAAPAPAAALPAQVGRYRVERLLGEGGFGRVYLARDEQLQRRVAVKVAHRHLIASPQDADAYLAEARTAAGLDHPHIVPVFDVGGTPEF